jgi:hypothetical protein
MKTNNQNFDTGTVHGVPLILLRAEGVFVFILSILLYAHTGAPWWRFAALLLVPDVVMAGYWINARWGAIFYNAGHSYIGPLCLAGFTVLSPHTGLLPYLLIWSAHIAMDRALGYGLKYSAGFKETHLGRLGVSGERAS